MHKMVIIIIVLFLSLCSVALSEGWTCPTCGNAATGNFCNLCGAANLSDEWICPQCKANAKGNYCSNCGSPKPKRSSQDHESESSLIVPSAIPTVDPNYKYQDVIVKNYVGRTLSLCGYTSWGVERRDEYAETTLLLVMQSTNGVYIDPNDDAALDSYKVIAQYPAANTPFSITTDLNGKEVNPGYGEIVLIVSKDGETIEEVPTLESINPSPNKTIQYVRDYKGRTLEDVGYTSMGGKRIDRYGPKGYVQISIVDEDGQKIDPKKTDDFIYYCVVDQDIKPNTEITFYYSNDKCTSQTIDIIQITVTKSEVGQATLKALAAEEEKLRATGDLKDLYQGTYEVGKDLSSGNYEFTQIGDSCRFYIYSSIEALDNNNGTWCDLHGKGDIETWYLKDGMFVKIKSGAAKAKRTSFSTDDSEFLLFSGAYQVGVEIAPGSYEMTHYTNSCNIYLYKDATAYQKNDRDWAYLYGKGDTEYYKLQEGMIIIISEGAASVKRK